MKAEWNVVGKLKLHFKKDLESFQIADDWFKVPSNLYILVQFALSTGMRMKRVQRIKLFV